MARDRATRLREFEQLERRAGLEHGYTRDRERRPLGINTMEAPEELMERRRRLHRKRVSIAAGNADTRSTLPENVFLLLTLIALIYGLYRLAIYLLNQP